MSGSITLDLHYWRGLGPDIEPDLFVIRWRLGFVTIAIERKSLLEAYRKLRAAIVQRVERDEAQRARDSDGQ